ncbi:GspH/FimT family pseudopilin [Neptunomonas sp. XY-337]|uniref:GspH/FimT family pseudopilin n=1 Tax=Neptunomonas sp. XY-337 TaxID=2561897 RepID=UPI0010A9BA11|nr:GspH/FimT family pseudopilin [Neptunomonas sp. XY-337]
MDIKISRAQCGFTLIELMVTTTVAIVLITVAVPAFTDLIAKIDLNTGSLQVREVLRQARSEAVKTGNALHVCSVADGVSQCAGTSGRGRKPWQHGMLVFHDANRDRRFTPGSDTLIYQVDFSAGLAVSWGRGDYLVYAGSGRPALANGTFELLHTASGYQKKLVLNNVGRIRSEQNW